MAPPPAGRTLAAVLRSSRPPSVRPICPYNFSATLSLALLARGFPAISSAVGTAGLFVMIRSTGTCPHVQTGRPGGQTHPVACEANTCFTIRSSSEW